MNKDKWLFILDMVSGLACTLIAGVTLHLGYDYHIGYLICLWVGGFVIGGGLSRRGWL